MKSVLLSGMIANNAIFSSPNLSNSSSSVFVIPSIVSRLNFSSFEASVTIIDFNVLPAPTMIIFVIFNSYMIWISMF